MACAIAMASPAAAQDWQGESAGLSLVTHARTYTLLLYDAGADDRRATLEGLGVDPAAFPGTDAEQAVVVERFRLVADAWAGERWSLEAAYELLPIFGALDTTGLFTAAQNPLRLVDFDRTLHDGDDWTVTHQLDRLVLRYLHPRFEVRVGRQAIGFGGARLYNAVDLFAPLGPATIDSEFKAGIDAARVIAPLGERHELSLTAVLNGDDPADGLYLAQWRGIFDGFDLGALAGSTYARPTAALTAAGDLGGTGWYVEAAGRLDDDDAPLVRATAGLDHHFEAGVRLLAELHYNGAGADAPDGYLDRQTEQPYAIGEVYLLGRYYAGALVSYELHPLVQIGASWLQNLTDGSALVSPTLSYDFAQEVSVGLGALIPIGERLTLSPFGLPTVESEFGLYPLVAFTDVRLVF